MVLHHAPDAVRNENCIALAGLRGLFKFHPTGEGEVGDIEVARHQYPCARFVDFQVVAGEVELPLGASFRKTQGAKRDAELGNPTVGVTGNGGIPNLVPGRGDAEVSSAFHRAFALCAHGVHPEGEAILPVVPGVDHHVEGIAHGEREIPFQALNHIGFIGMCIVANGRHVEIFCVGSEHHFRPRLAQCSIVGKMLPESADHCGSLPDLLLQQSIGLHRFTRKSNLGDGLFRRIGRQMESAAGK